MSERSASGSPLRPSSSSSSLPETPSPETPPNWHQNSNDPSATWIVQKYGGTSVGKFASRISEEIVPQYLDQHRVAIVCSARSGTTKDLGTTNLLLRAADEALNVRKPTYTPFATSGAATPFTPYPNHVSQRSRDWSASPHASRSGSVSRPQSPNTTNGIAPLSQLTSSNGDSPASAFPFPAYYATIDLIRNEHLKAARENVKNVDLLAELEGDIERDCDGLQHFLSATQVIEEISPRSKDSIVGAGERLACKLISTILRDRGVDSEVVVLDDIVPPDEENDVATGGSSGGQLGQEFYDRLAVALGERIRGCGQRVPVITGFFGPVPGSLLRQIGRGYTDLTAALVAVGLAAAELQIWKEVDGIFTADPRKVPTARLIPIISPDEAAELTYYGSEVIHPFTMEQVIRRKIPIRIKNVENPSGSGTVIHPDADDSIVVDEAPSSSTTSLGFINQPPQYNLPFSGPPSANYILSSQSHSLSSPSSTIHRRLPTAVTIKEHIVVLSINSNRKTISHGFLASIFGTLDKFGVVVDLISTSEVHVSLAIESTSGSVGDKRAFNKIVKELEKIGTVIVHLDMAILSLVGKQMKNMVGIAGRMFTALADGNVNLEMISQGASEINISCVIDGRDAVKSLNLIHQTCLQIKPEGARGIVGQWLF